MVGMNSDGSLAHLIYLYIYLFLVSTDCVAVEATMIEEKRLHSTTTTIRATTMVETDQATIDPTQEEGLMVIAHQTKMG